MMRKRTPAPGTRSTFRPQFVRIDLSPRLRTGRFTATLIALLVISASSRGSAQTSPSAVPRSVVVIDAAHGGDDAGARLGTQAEKDFTLALSVKLRSLLTARGFSVVTTRESDATIDAGRRAETANHANALACLSLHAAETGSGVHLFVSSLPPAEAARFVAWKTAQAAWVDKSLSLAGVLNSALTHGGLHITLGRTSMPAIDSMACPAVAVEIAPDLGASSNSASGLSNPLYQSRIAEALAAALVEWREEFKKGGEP